MDQSKEYVIKLEVAQVVMNYLITKPYQESAQLIKLMAELKPLDHSGVTLDNGPVQSGKESEV